MPNYRAPVQDIQFVITELLELENFSAACGYPDATPEMLEAILGEAAKLANEVIAPLNQSGDRERTALSEGQVRTPQGFAKAYRQFAANGWLGISQPPQYGGQGLPELFSAAVSEMLNAANLSFALNPMLSTAAIRALIVHGDETLRQRYLAKLISGVWTGTMNLTEPQAGSDLSAVATKALPDGGRYLLSGQKIFITWGDHDMAENILHLVLARIPGAPEGVKGISLFLVPKYLANADGSLGAANDLRVVSLEHKLGIHASPTCVMSFGEQGGAEGYLVGQENQGLAHMFTMMNHARLGVGIEGAGLAERAYQDAVAYAKQRVQGYAPETKERVAIIRHPDVRRMLMQMRCISEAARGLCLITAAEMDKAQELKTPELRESAQARLDVLVPIAKAWCTEMAQEATSLSIQVHGGMGYIEETGVAQYFRDARITTIYEGTTGIQALDLIGRKILRDRGAAFTLLLSEIESFVGQMTQMEQTEPALAGIHTRLSEACDALRRAGAWLLALDQTARPHAPGAAAVNLLMLAGTLLGGWQLARAAVIAAQNLQHSRGDLEFYRAKLITARFYAEHLLPRCQAYAGAVLAGEESTMALADDRF